MINRKLITLFLLIASFTSLKSQRVNQLGYYSFNGIFSLSAIPNYMVLGNGNLVNVSNPSAPTLTGSTSLSGFSTSVLVDSNYAYYGSGMSVKLTIVDISNPSFPLQAGSKSFPQLNGGAFGMDKKNATLFMAMGADGIYSINVSNKSNPVILDSLSIPNGQARDIIIRNNYAYVAHGNGLKVINISNPANLTVDTSIGTGYNSVELNGNLVFLGKTSGGIDAFNISNPIAPTPAFAIPNSNGTAWEIKSKNNLIYLATDAGGLFVYKFTITSAIQMAQFANSGNGQSFGLAVQDSLIFLSGLVNGVAILQYDSLGTVGLQHTKLSESPIIYPNPSTNYITFIDVEEEITSIEIITIQGKTVTSQRNLHPQKKIDISSLPTGLYMVRLKTKRSQFVQRFIKAE